MRKLLIIFVFLLGLAATAGATERAWYGFHIKPQLVGFPLNPVVKSVVIDKVKANSPATAHNIAIGDEIIEAEGKTVPGARALQLLWIANKQPGEWLHMRLKRTNGQTYSVTVQGTKKPST
jgi:S1-C subfamily serine protease